jgi:RimJ/RimL family protein N-acetyltransferase
MLPICLPDQPGGGITVHGFDAGDAPGLFAALDYDQVWTYIPGARPRTPDELTARLTKASTQQPLVIRRDGDIVGTSSFHLDPSDPSGVEIGSTLLTPEIWGSGMNTAVKQMMLAAAFGAGAQWVQLRTDERNDRSVAAILKLLGVVEVESRLEPQWIRADGTVRTSRMFRVQRPTPGNRQT